ncbi:hypothetical protein [Salipiger sp.]|uniref:hypothetical protein n=1 Tax=Salipiger sp. TaxID=2078585 RepID=UPI003A970E65
MPLTWTAPAPLEFRDAYLDFSWLVRQRRQPPVGSDLHEPAFVRLKGADPAKARRTLRDLVRDATSPLLMEPHEFGVLDARCGATDPDAGLPDEYALYRRLGTADADHAALFDVLDTGSPVSLQPDTAPAAPAIPAAPRRRPTSRPIVAAIDDGIGFLNGRFRTSAGATRFHAVWLQALEQGGPQKSAHLGQVLTAAEIDAAIARAGMDETAEYCAVNAGLIHADAHRSSEHGASHGTHMLDLAAGADPAEPGDPALGWPLLAVQLPPQAIADTSGTHFESYMVQAMRWILRRAQEIDPAAPVIVNISMGMHAGPKDGTRFAEYQIAREAALWEQVKKQPVRVVWAFGNDHDSRLMAELSYDKAQARKATDQSIEWRIQPGDQTESYLELRTPSKDMPVSALQIELETPDGLASGFAALAEGEARSLDLDGGAVARLYHVPARTLDTGIEQRAHMVIAVAPTESCHGEPLAPAGAWTLRLRYKGAPALRATLQIQRDVNLVGYRGEARQSYFDSPEAYGWDDRQQDHTALESDSPIRHDGSLSALATVRARQIFTAGAAVEDAESALKRPARYAARGADWTVSGPTASTVADRSGNRPGQLGCGTLSGTSRAINGTSAGAALMTRALALSADRIVANAAAGGGTQLDDFDWTVLDRWMVPQADTGRLGPYVIRPRDDTGPASGPDV